MTPREGGKEKRKPRPRLESCQGPWSSVASASTPFRGRGPTPTRRSSRATGKLLGECARKKGREEGEDVRRRPGLLCFFLFSSRNKNGMDTSEASTRASGEDGRRQPSVLGARQPDSRPTACKKPHVISEKPKKQFDRSQRAERTLSTSRTTACLERARLRAISTFSSACDFFVMTTRVRPTPRNLRGRKTQLYNVSWVDAARHHQGEELHGLLAEELPCYFPLALSVGWDILNGSFPCSLRPR